MPADEFRSVGHELVDHIADFLESISRRPVTAGHSPRDVRKLLGHASLPEHGLPADKLMRDTAELLFRHSLFNGHPRFLGYITSSAAPIGALADFLAAAVNPNVGAFTLSPLATEMEAQTVRWIAELIGYPTTCGGLLVSGGNMANFVCFVAARKAKFSWDVRTAGVAAGNIIPRVYASGETHTWLQKAADLFGLGTNSLCWIEVDNDLRMKTSDLKKRIEDDKQTGRVPFLVVGTAGSVSTGTTDPLREIAAVCREHHLWFHVDGAYGAPAAALPGTPPDLKALAEADSVAVDPHKWLYAPLEAGCALVRGPSALTDAFSYHPPYYHLEGGEEDPPINYYEHGLQNSRGFRALKVWLGLRQVGRKGYVRMISDDIALSEEMQRRIQATPDLEPYTQQLSINTFRYVPQDLKSGSNEVETYLNELNAELLTRLQKSGEAYLSNAVINEKFLLRSCIVNFRTSLKDVQALPDIVVRFGRATDAEIRTDRFPKQL